VEVLIVEEELKRAARPAQSRDFSKSLHVASGEEAGVEPASSLEKKDRAPKKSSQKFG
jgi:hypothetical protein